MFTGFVIDEKSLQKDWIQNIFKINVEYERVSFFFSTVEIDTESQGFISHFWGKFYQHFDKIGQKKGLDMIHFKFQHEL